MFSLYRPILASLLCGVIVLGHAPVWLHVGSCEGHGHVPSTSTGETVAVCVHGCQHHTAPHKFAEAAKTVSQPNDSPPQHQHDSDTCLMCQSLASSNGVNWELSISLPTEFTSRPVLVAADSVLLATLLSIPQPRGPPVVA